MSLVGLCLALAPHLAPPVAAPVTPPPPPPARADDPAVVDSRIGTVTVYPGSAMVTRTAAVPGPGSYVFRDLPLALDPDSVRVRPGAGARLEVLGVEPSLRFVREVADERMAALEAERRELVRQLQALRDDQRALSELEAHLAALLEPSTGDAARDDGARPDLDTWAAAGAFLADELVTVRADLRDQARAVAEAEALLARLEEEYALGSRGAGRQVRDVLVQLDGPAGGTGGPIELEYLVSGAGWQPVYDLRAEDDLSAVELVHRAEVTQRTGEDWEDVELLLSTARPEVGAAPPPLLAVWLELTAPVRFERSRAAKVAGPAAPGTAANAWYLGADLEQEFDPTPYFASVLTGGSSLRYRVARRETLESRPDPATVLVGRATLDVEAERYCAPALDEHVWLRGRATNDSPWVLLPGEASVYFGGDFVGQARLDRVRLGETFDLHLGLDPMVTFERVELEHKESDSGFFGTRKSITEGWRLRFENHGAAGTGPGRPARVIVREALPRSTDERLDIELEDSTPAVSAAARWARDREDLGILTWELDVPRGAPAVVEWTTSLTFPEDLELAR